MAERSWDPLAPVNPDNSGYDKAPPRDRPKDGPERISETLRLARKLPNPTHVGPIHEREFTSEALRIATDPNFRGYF